LGAAAAAATATAAAAAVAAAAGAGWENAVQGHAGGGGYIVERIGEGTREREREREKVGVCPCAGTTDYTVLHRIATSRNHPFYTPFFSCTALTRPPLAFSSSCIHPSRKKIVKADRYTVEIELQYVSPSFGNIGIPCIPLFLSFAKSEIRSFGELLVLTIRLLDSFTCIHCTINF